MIVKVDAAARLSAQQELAVLNRMSMCMYDPAETPMQWRSRYDRQLAQCELARKKQETECVIKCPYMRLHDLVHGLTGEIRARLRAASLSRNTRVSMVIWIYCAE